MKTTLSIISLLISSILYSQHTILWKISNPTNKNISYLLGTNHVFGESFVDSFPIIREKIQSTDIIITETKMDRAKITATFNSRPTSDSLYIVLSREDADYISNSIFRKTPAEMSRYTAGELLIKLQAYYPKVKCGVINKKDRLTMDEYVQNIGSSYNKQSYNLETDSFQVEKISSAFNKYDWSFFKKNALVMLKLYRNEKSNDMMCTLADQYASFNMDYKFKDECNFLKGSSLNNDELVKKRNQDWMQQLPGLLEKSNCFIAVGFGHLCNQCGLIKQLEAIGYTVAPVTMK